MIRCYDDLFRIHERRDAQSITGLAGTAGVVEREYSRFQFVEHEATVGTAIFSAVGLSSLFDLTLRINAAQHDRAIGETDRCFDGFCQPRSHFIANDDPVDNDLDRMVCIPFQFWYGFSVVDNAVDPDSNKSFFAQLVDDVFVFSLSVSHDRRQQRNA